MNKREKWIDIAKGICLFSVFMGHFGIQKLEFLLSFNLTTFFILAGYTLKKADLTGEYMTKKFRRLMTPYFITCAAVVVADVINVMVTERNFSTALITKTLSDGLIKTFAASGGSYDIATIPLGKGIGAIWFFPALFFALIITQLVLKLPSKALKGGVAVGLFLLASILIKVTWLPFSILSSFFSIPFILFGMWLKKSAVLEKLKLYHYIILLAVFVVGCFLGKAQGFYMVGCFATDRLLTPLFALCSSVVILGLSRLIKSCPPIEFVGRNSLVFLCVHLFEMNTLGSYYTKLLDAVGLSGNTPARIVAKIIVIAVVGTAAVYISKRLEKESPPASIPNAESLTPDRTFGIMRTILIILMLVGLAKIDKGLHSFIYSFHMMAFVMISGYFFSPISFKANLKRTVLVLRPYAVFCVLYVLLFHRGIVNELQTVLLGMCYSKNILTDVKSVGPVFFILTLCATRTVYFFIDKLKNEHHKNIAVCASAALGLHLGRVGFWLPWAFDGALVCVLFYRIAQYMKRCNLLKKAADYPFVYFPLACIWAYYKYLSPIEFAKRDYGDIGLTVAGNVSAFVIVYLLSRYLAPRVPKFVSRAAELVGEATAYILILYTLFGTRVSEFAEHTLGLNPQNIFHLVFCVSAQIVAGAIIFFAVDKVKKLLKRPRTKANPAEKQTV